MKELDSQIVQRQTSHLFVLVGSNPLPNYVAARLLLKPGGTLYLVHSQQVTEIAKRITDVMGHILGKNAVLINVDEGLGSDVYRRIGQALNGIDLSENVGLHYTGGTKVMSVHACRRMRDLEREKGRTIFYSYLDASQLSLVFDEPDGTSRRVPVREALDMSFVDHMVKLHGYTPVLGQQIKKTPDYPEYAQQLAAYFYSSVSKEYVSRPGKPVSTRDRPYTDYQKWLSWVDEERLGDDKYISRLKSKESIDGLKQLQLPLEKCPGLRQVFPGCMCLQDVAGLFCEDDVKEVCYWLGGLWLEDLALSAILKIKETARIQQAYRSVKLVPHSSIFTVPDQTKNPLEFEIDIVALRGYQLFVISCSTSLNKKTLKLKLFEAFVRAHQFGGDEARIALLCGALPYHQRYNIDSYPRLIQQEIEQEWDAFKKIRVYGIEDWVNLTNVLKDWFETT